MYDSYLNDGVKALVASDTFMVKPFSFIIATVFYQHN